MQYPIIEGLNGFLWVFVFLVNGMNVMSVVYCLMTSALLVLSVIDWRTFEIPFGINVFLGILGIVAVVLDKGEWLNHVIGAVCVSGFLLLLYLLSKGRAIGGGGYQADGSVRAVARLAEEYSGIFTGLYSRFRDSSVSHENQ